jgi:crossover junction endodeoxyribonuclease RusA
MRPDGAWTLVVHGRAAPQGSKDLMTKASGQKYMKESSDNVKPWRTKIRRACLGPDGRPLAVFTGPVVVSIDFEFRQAKSNQDDYPTGQNIGDVDKLTRAVLDALTQAGVIEDDRYVVHVSASKAWGGDDRTLIHVRQAEQPDRLVPSVVDFAEQIGQPLEPWQRFVLDEIRRVPHQRRPPNPFL